MAMNSRATCRLGIPPFGAPERILVGIEQEPHPTPPSHGGLDRADHTAAGQVEHRDIQAVSGPHHLQFVDQHGLNFPLRHESSGAGALQFGPLIHHVGWDVVTRKRRHCLLGLEDIGAHPP